MTSTVSTIAGFKNVFSRDEHQEYSTELTEKKRPQRNYMAVVAGISFLIAISALVISIVLFVKMNSPTPSAPLPSSAALAGQDIQTYQEKMMESLQEMNTTLNRFLKYGDKVELCSVGIKAGLVKDADLSASSFHSTPYRAQYGRLDRPGSKFAFWHPRICGKVGDWLQVYLRTPTRVTGVVTQGRSDSVEDWVTGYKVAYGNSPDELQNVQVNGTDVIFDGNTDMHTHKTNMLPQPITARYFRIIVQTWTRCISMRMELLTC